MKASFITRALTLFCFASLITLFIAYRSGSFDSYIARDNMLQTSHNGGAMTEAQIDSLIKNTPKDGTLFPSTKSIVMPLTLSRRQRRLLVKAEAKALKKKQKAIQDSIKRAHR